MSTQLLSRINRGRDPAPTPLQAAREGQPWQCCRQPKIARAGAATARHRARAPVPTRTARRPNLMQPDARGSPPGSACRGPSGSSLLGPRPRAEAPASPPPGPWKPCQPFAFSDSIFRRREADYRGKRRGHRCLPITFLVLRGKSAGCRDALVCLQWPRIAGIRCGTLAQQAAASSYVGTSDRGQRKKG